jgi:hypothetical protein
MRPFSIVNEIVATRSFNRAGGLTAEFERLGAQLDVHGARSRLRASRIRCISIDPDATVDACA